MEVKAERVRPSGDRLSPSENGAVVDASAVATPYHEPDVPCLTRRQVMGTLIGLLLTMLLVAVDQTIVGTAMPRIIAQLNGFNQYPWVTTAYLLTSTLAMPIFAKLSDLYGRKHFILSGNILFVLASALCGAAGEIPHLPGDGMTQLIVFRAIQGIGGGMATALMFTIIGDMFAPAERARYQALFAAMYGLASIIGPTVGGWITDQFSWRWTFYINLPIGAAAAAAIFLQLPQFQVSTRRRVIDWWGLVTLVAWLVPLLLALTWVVDYGWSSYRVAAFLALALFMLGAFLICEKRSSEPLLPLALFQDPIIAVSFVAIFMLGLGMFGVALYVPLFMQGVMGVSATRSGSLLTPLLMAAVVGSLAAGQIIGRTGRYRWLAVFGSMLAAIGMFLMALMNKSTTDIQIVRNMAIAGLGMGIMQPIYVLVVQNVAPAAQRGIATGSAQFFRSIGSTVGVAVFGSILLSTFHQDFQQNVPTQTPQHVLALFKNPLLVVRNREHLQTVLGQQAEGAELMHRLLENVRNGLVHGLHLVFLMVAVLMTAGIAVNLFLREAPLRKRAVPAASGTTRQTAVEPSAAT
jgi:EmrB/QacA subfamily drug resistance transporter